ncbi:MAG TPA: HEAT repeat domain-containing protein, partial [Kofleriaceae bacterium]|nr:HEAT repeat domain-containing protein [Kofleriaceae bacterium]
RLGEAAAAACANDLVRALPAADGPLAGLLVDLLRQPHASIGAALARGLDGADDAQARRLCELLVARADADDLLAGAFERLGAQEAAARGLVMLGKERLGRGRAVLERGRVAQEAGTRTIARAALLAIDGPPEQPAVPPVAGFETTLLDKGALSTTLDVRGLLPFLADGRAVVRANAATGLGAQGARAVPYATTIAALLRDDDAQVRVAVARALDQLGDDAVVAVAPQLVRALAADPSTADACRAALAARKEKVEAALAAGLDTLDATHGARVADLIVALPNGRDLLFAAFDGPAYHAQVNAAIGIGKLGAKRAGADGVRRLISALPGPPTSRRYAALAALAALGVDPLAGR